MVFSRRESLIAKKTDHSDIEANVFPFDNPDVVQKQTVYSYWWFRNKQRPALLRRTLSLFRRTFVILRDGPNEFIPALRRKVQTSRKYLRRPKIVNLPIDDLIFPNRLDIWLRVMFLKAYDDAQGSLEFTQTPYYIFRVDLARTHAWAPSADESVQRFLAIYKSIQSSGYVRDNAKDDYIKVVHFPDSSNRSPYALFDGAHRLAVLKHLGYQTAACCIVNELFTPPDYTSLILSKDYAKCGKILHVISEWHTTCANCERSLKDG